ncbi:MAG: ergothioneine biosynthesis protein EgtB [Gemmatimonadales bacterium]|nr:MAG: ergothioneine biosynthesis protein EgtB [Gemmatimonadales bacterium]
MESASLLPRFQEVRRFTTALTEGLAPEDQVVQSMEDVSPTKWHLAHTSWFWEVFVLEPHLAGYRALDPDYHFLFNSYYVQAGERHCRAQRGWLSRPTVAQVMDYRAHVDQGMEALLSDADRMAGDAELRALVELGMNHEQQHQELMLTDLKHVFGVNPLRPAYRAIEPAGASPAAMAPPLRFVEFPGGVHEIGQAGAGNQASNGGPFAYDNEGPRHRRFLEPFALADRLVTNGEYLAFRADGGYRRPELWMSAGWAAREAHGWTEPFYWEERGGTWWGFTLSGLRELRMNEPVVHLNWYEADAYARWAGARLPREDEWEVAARAALEAGAPFAGNLAEGGRFHPAPASGSESGSGPATIRQLFGDAWEWTASDYAPYPGYRAAPGAVGEYNGKFMTGQYVLRGGSCATSRSHLRITYRNFFPPEAAWQFTGLRLARD